MRVIAGQAKGRRILPPPQKGVRPTTDFAREALFNILSPLAGQKFCDLYAGSGAVGIEALSRSAARVIFVESDRAATEIIKENVRRCGFIDRCYALHETVSSAVAKMAARKERFDVLFADPPYATGALATVLGLIVSENIIKDDGMLIVQHAPFDVAVALPTGCQLTDWRKYGNTVFSFYRIS